MYCEATEGKVLFIVIQAITTAGLRLAFNGRFGKMAAVTRRQFCGNLHVTTPQEA
jgi:hypothetical protein